MNVSFEKFGIVNFRAKIHYLNIRSIKMFEKIGFIKSDKLRHENFITMEKYANEYHL